jgi:hypothetical protein
MLVAPDSGKRHARAIRTKLAVFAHTTGPEASIFFRKLRIP